MTMPMYGMKKVSRQSFFYSDAKLLFDMILKLQDVSLKYHVFLNDKKITEFEVTPYGVDILANQSISFSDPKPLFDLLLKLQQMHISYELFEENSPQ